MFAFAMGGASNLSPIKGKRAQENGGQPNWKAFERAYATISTLNLGIGWLNVVVALGMGWFGLSNLLSGYEAKGVIWMAFGLMQLSSLLVFIFQRYQIALIGMNYVALNNRWGIIFSLLSVAFGSLTLWMGGGIIALVLVMQFLAVAGVLRNRFLLRAVEGGRVLRFKQYGFDREVFGWAWAPTWKGFVGLFGMQGSIQLTAVIYTGYGSKTEVASFLFAVRILQTIVQTGNAPFGSVQPLMGRLLASGEIVKLGSIVRQRISISLALTAIGIVLSGVLLPWLLETIGSTIPFLDFEAWFLMGALVLLFRFNIINGAVCGLGNYIVFYWDLLIALALTLIILFVFRNHYGVYTPIIAMYAPAICILNIRPYLKASSIFSARAKAKWGLEFALIYLAFISVAATLIFYEI